jgi:hypothetical protein
MAAQSALNRQGQVGMDTDIEQTFARNPDASLASEAGRQWLASRDIAADLRGALQAPPDTGFPAIVELKRVGELLRAIDGFEGPPHADLCAKAHIRPAWTRARG